MKFITLFALQSQGERLYESGPYISTSGYKWGCHPLWHPFSRDSIQRIHKETLRETTIRQYYVDFQFELFPVHSPLLRKSLLIYFPPLTNMLKFSGYSCSISGLCQVLLKRTWNLYQVTPWLQGF